MINVLVTGGECDGGDIGRRAGESDVDTQTFWQGKIEHHGNPLRREIIFAAAKEEELAFC